MVNFSIAANNQQASAIAARDALVALSEQASAQCDVKVLAKALELTRVWLPAELHSAVDDILHEHARSKRRQEAGAA